MQPWDSQHEHPLKHDETDKKDPVLGQMFGPSWEVLNGLHARGINADECR
jgi:hypothetical protein